MRFMAKLGVWLAALAGIVALQNSAPYFNMPPSDAGLVVSLGSMALLFFAVLFTVRRDAPGSQQGRP